MFRNTRSIFSKVMAISRKPIAINSAPGSACMLIRQVSYKDFVGEWLQAETRRENIVETEELKDLIKNDKVFLIDVREPDEVAQGHVPAKRYVNIPIGVVFQSLAMTEEEFKEKYGQDKPQMTDDDIVFMCLVGIRSTFAFQLAKQMGFLGSKHYLGGWMGWEESQAS